MSSERRRLLGGTDVELFINCKGGRKHAIVFLTHFVSPRFFEENRELLADVVAELADDVPWYAVIHRFIREDQA